jgi:uncharacterized membrane protein YdbT with pleckstrin-like domain
MKCPFCGVALKDDNPKFCSSCGKTIPAAPAPIVGPQGAGILAPGQEEVFFEGRPAAIQSVAGLFLAILTLGISWIVQSIRMRSTKYRITSQRIIIETGLFSPKLEQVDLYRIVDYVVERPFFQRIMGTGNITFETLDKTQPEVRITGIRTDVVGLYERIRTATEAEKRRRGVALVDMEHQ